MDQIFQDYYDGVIDGDDLLRETYATYHNVPTKWLECEAITVKDLVNRICDDFESNGFDLEELPLVNIREKFIEYEPVVRVPLEYTQLLDAKQQAQEQLTNLKNDPKFAKLDSFVRIIAHIETMIVSIDNKLQELV